MPDSPCVRKNRPFTVPLDWGIPKTNRDARQEKEKMADLYVGKETEFGERDRKIIAQGDLEIGVFRVDGKFYAWENNCSHQGGPVCQGKILAKVEEVLGADKTSQGLKFSDENIHICRGTFSTTSRWAPPGRQERSPQVVPCGGERRVVVGS
jgi:hypothetical protein